MARERHIDFPYADTFAATLPALPGAGVDWLARLRAEAAAHLAETGLPTQRVEAWKYTSLKPLLKGRHRPAAAAADSAPTPAPRDGLLPWDAPAHRLVFLNGRYRADLSAPGRLPEGVVLRPLAEAAVAPDGLVERHLARLAPLNGNALVALNTAFWDGGVLLHLADGARLEQPVHVVSFGAAADGPLAFHPRLLVIAGADSEAALVESHFGDGAYWSNPLAEIALGDGAALRHYKLQDEAATATHLAYSKVRLGRASRYESFAFAVGARLARNEIAVVLDGERAEARLLGGYIADGGQHLDTTTVIEHAKPHGTSVELYKGVLDGRSRGVFQGKIAVRQDAQKTDAHMLSKALLLSPQAEVDSKPELEIYADDVKCGHGATAGEIDEDALFYLRARGIGEAAARNMLIEAFLMDIAEQVSFAPVRERIGDLVAGWLAGRGRNGGKR